MTRTLPLLLSCMLMGGQAWAQDISTVANPPDWNDRASIEAWLKTLQVTDVAACRHEDHDICPPMGRPKVIITVDPGGGVGRGPDGVYAITRPAPRHTMVFEIHPDGSIEKTQDYDGPP